MSEEKISTKLNEYNLLSQIVGNYYQLPISFCLKEFLNWDDAKIKSFLKEQNKQIKKNQKQAKEMQSILVNASSTTTCCGGKCN